jgi:DMSO/TMAO reductase YedYZ molybdopterin-dependent catalytic subunit
MSKKLLGSIVCLVFVFFTILGITNPTAALAADPPPTTSITVTKYAADGTTVLDRKILGLADLQAMNVQGDGITHYYTQGPTFDPDNLWDPAETENLKDKGAVRGTDVKDLCNLVGGAVSGDIVKIKGSDGYNDRFRYEDIYNPEPAQGKFVICWEQNGVTVPSYLEGMQLVFFSQTTNAAGRYVFGHEDMRNTLPAANWHYNWDDGIQYPSANGLSIKWISQISIFSNPTPAWDLELSGDSDYIMIQREFEDGAACTSGSHGVTWTDGSGNVWSGFPLWLLCGWVDDSIVHGAGAFNDAMATAGYHVKVSNADGSSYTFESAFVARNSNIIVANTMNGAPLPVGKYPLKLVGSALTLDSQGVSKITKIELLNLPHLVAWELALDGASAYTMNQAVFESGVNCLTDNHAKTYTNGSGTWKGLPLWLLCGWVDDNIQHGSGAFNDAVAAAGYDIKVTSSDGSSYTFDSNFVARNENIIVANTLDNAPLPDAAYPLALVGSAISGGQMVSRIVKIELLNLPNQITASAGVNGSISPSGDIEVAYGADQSFTITPAVGYHAADVVIDGSSIGPITRYKFSNVTTNHTISATFAAGGTWYLENDTTMENTPGRQSGFVNLLDEETGIWLTNIPATNTISFSSGDWIASLYAPDWGAGGCVIQVGVSHNGVFKAFTSSGTPTFSPYTGYIIVTIPTLSSETVKAGDFLAISITNNSGSAQDIATDGSSFLSLPESDPGYPVPEMTAGVLLSLGLALFMFIVIRGRKQIKNGTMIG